MIRIRNISNMHIINKQKIDPCFDWKWDRFRAAVSEIRSLVITYDHSAKAYRATASLIMRNPGNTFLNKGKVKYHLECRPLSSVRSYANCTFHLLNYSSTRISKKFGFEGQQQSFGTRWCSYSAPCQNRVPSYNNFLSDPYQVIYLRLKKVSM
jgi:hypothetical protein